MYYTGNTLLPSNHVLCPRFGHFKLLRSSRGKVEVPSCTNDPMYHRLLNMDNMPFSEAFECIHAA